MGPVGRNSQCRYSVFTVRMAKCVPTPVMLVPEAKHREYPPVVPVDRIAEIGGIVRNHRVCEFVIVQHSTAAGRPVNDVDAICPAIVHVHSVLDLLIAS